MERRLELDGELREMTCSASRGDSPPLTDEAIQEMMRQIPDWTLLQEEGIDKLTRTFKFSNFLEALEFTNRLGEVAEEQGHHPIITLTWGRTTVTWFTHDIEGLHRNDFIMAAKTDELYSPA